MRKLAYLLAKHLAGLIRASLLFLCFSYKLVKKTGSVGRQKKPINTKLAMDDALQIHIIFVCTNTTTAGVPTLYALVCAHQSKKLR